jgi:hypothetical protein
MLRDNLSSLKEPSRMRLVRHARDTAHTVWTAAGAMDSKSENYLVQMGRAADSSWEPAEILSDFVSVQTSEIPQDLLLLARIGGSVFRNSKFEDWHARGLVLDDEMPALNRGVRAAMLTGFAAALDLCTPGSRLRAEAATLEQVLGRGRLLPSYVQALRL